MAEENAKAQSSGGFVNKALNIIETIGNKLPDPAILFLILLIVVWVLVLQLVVCGMGSSHASSTGSMVGCQSVVMFVSVPGTSPHSRPRQLELGCGAGMGSWCPCRGAHIHTHTSGIRKVRLDPQVFPGPRVIGECCWTESKDRR